jgi:prepilin-type N-terminal cleavage/methylation domain-containing protein
MVLKNKGVTLIELMLVMLILAVLMVAMTAALNPANLVNKGKDATRKKDLKRIKVAFEEYYNDKGCYPSQELIDDLNSMDCGTTGLYQLNPWPCDPDRTKYRVMTEPPVTDCPDWFVVLTTLKASGDKDIVSVEGKKYNYCVSSTDKNCMDYNEDEDVQGVASADADFGLNEVEPTSIPECCDLSDCHRLSGGVSCNSTSSCSGGECYYSAINCPGSNNNPCLDICKTDSCGQ